jgi:hypothetical protein
MTMNQRKTLFERFQQALHEGIAHARGRFTLRMVEVPEVPPEFDGMTRATLQKLANQVSLDDEVGR